MLSKSYLGLGVVRLKSPEKWVSEPYRLHFVFPKEGTGQYTAPSVTHHLVPGDVLIVNTTSEGELRADDGGEFAFSFFSALPEHIFPLFSSSEINLLRNVSEGFKAAKLHSSTTMLAKECHQLLEGATLNSNLAHRSQLLRVVAAIFTSELQTVQPSLPGFVRAEDHLRQVLDKVSVEELMSGSVSELAARFGWSKRHLNRMFQVHFGLSVAALKMELRLLKALSLLREPDAKIISIAEQCGFNYLGLFNTCFKKRFGVTPTQHRKKMIEAEGQSAQPVGHNLAWACPLKSLAHSCAWLHEPEGRHASGFCLRVSLKAQPARSALRVPVPAGNQIAVGVGLGHHGPAMPSPLAA